MSQAYGRIDPDGSRYLLGDYKGGLYLLLLTHDANSVIGLKLEPLGRTSVPSCISYLDSSVVFVVGCAMCLSIVLVPHLRGPCIDAHNR